MNIEDFEGSEKNVVSLSVWLTNGDVIQRAWRISDDSIEGMLRVLGTPYTEVLVPANFMNNLQEFVGSDGDTTIRTYPQEEDKRGDL